MIFDLKANDVSTITCIMSKCDIATSKFGQSFAKIILEDSSGKMNCVMWDNIHRLDNLKPGDVVQATILIETYNNSLQARIRNIEKASADNTDFAKLIKMSRFDVNTMVTEIIDLAKTIQDVWWSKLACYFYSDSDFLKVFRMHPAAKSMHHAYGGGLLQHTLHVAKLTDAVCSIYSNDPLDRDLAVTVALLHDIGKLHELQALPKHGYSVNGRFVGHVVESQNMIRDACSSIADFPDDKRDLICHCILAHHGELEYGSPKVPMCLEAMIVHYCDMIDSREDILISAVDENRASLQDDKFTPFVKGLNTSITTSELFE